ncbi:MAG: hypothetical protein P9L94_20390 [Candidatus Hinthialibacter antarcticus]|nr:hypothetical protein [Candidatus Hinthialibacter antarcticus]
MSVTEDSKAALQLTASVLFWCTVIGFGILLIWFGFILIGFMDFAYSIHSQFGSFSRQQFDIMMYMGLMFWKMAVMLFFLLPYISIKIVLRKQP